MRLRATVSFTDDVADAIEVWDDADDASALDSARRWGAVMAGIIPGATAKELEQDCSTHGWESHHTCDCCEVATCYRECADNELDHRQPYCNNCMGDNDPDAGGSGCDGCRSGCESCAETDAMR